MFSENLKTIRKSKGLSQEEVASRMNVVRQTVFKWEKGLSVPDAEMLIKMANLFEVSVNELLGAKLDSSSNVNEIAEQLSRINEAACYKKSSFSPHLESCYRYLYCFCCVQYHSYDS